jgi:ubiquinone/menaquinone biosynthesis C-methylase UbiE
MKSHWEQVYSTKAADQVTWFQEHAARSLALIVASGIKRSDAIIDVGGGASTLVDDLQTAGYSALTVLDLSAAALATATSRLGPRADAVTWLEGDVTAMPLPVAAFDLWHDRAVFHFLTAPAARQAYVGAALRALKPGGHLIVATFAEDGPPQCSGLPVMRYDAGRLHAEFGAPFTLLRHEREEHGTPFGTVQKFTYCHFRRTTT